MSHINKSEVTFSRVGRQRSPSYPNISLPEAISLVRKINEVAMSTPIAEDNLAQQLGYEAGSSWLGLRLSALSKFGLLEIIPASPTRGKMCELTGLADRLMPWSQNQNPEDHKAALRQAALRAPIYNDLWTRFGPELPADAEMAAYLVAERKFNRNVVSSVLADFRATAECADLKSMPMPKPRVDAATLDAYSRIRAMDRARLLGTPPVGQTHFIGTPTGGSALEEARKMLQQMQEESDYRVASIPLADGETATITMPKKMSPQSWQMLLDTLELWKKQASAV